MKYDARSLNLSDLPVVIVPTADVGAALAKTPGSACFPHADGERMIVGPLDAVQCAIKVIARDAKRALTGDTTIPGIGQAQRRAYRVIGQVLAQARYLADLLRHDPERIDETGEGSFSVPTHGRGTETVRIPLDGIDAVGGRLYAGSLLLTATGQHYAVGWGRRKADDGSWEYSTALVPIIRDAIMVSLDVLSPPPAEESAPEPKPEPEAKVKRKKAA